MIVIQSPRLQLIQFQMMDAQEVFGCITPAIAKFMPWEPPSWSEYVTRCERRVQAPEPNNFSFVIRRLDNREMPWHGVIGRRGFCFARTRPLADRKSTRLNS